MKKQLYIYAFFILLFAVYNIFFQVEDQKTNAVINILLSSFLFLYLAYLAYLILKKIKKGSGK